jgi:hypothetical protein
MRIKDSIQEEWAGLEQFLRVCKVYASYPNTVEEVDRYNRHNFEQLVSKSLRQYFGTHYRAMRLYYFTATGRKREMSKYRKWYMATHKTKAMHFMPVTRKGQTTCKLFGYSYDD